MVLICVAAAVAALVLLVLFAPIRIRIRADGDYRITAGWTLIRVTLFPKKQGKADKSKRPPKEKSNKKPSPVKSYIDGLIEEKGTRGALAELRDIAAEALRDLKPFLTGLRFRVRRLEIHVASKDAATTALEYGAICTGVYGLLGRMQGVTRMKRKHIGIYSDFGKAKGSIAADITASVMPVCILKTALPLIKLYIKRIKNNIKDKKGEQNDG